MTVDLGSNPALSWDDGEIIPVGEEPPWEEPMVVPATQAVAGSQSVSQREKAASPKKGTGMPRGDHRGSKTKLKDRANTLRVFTVETMGNLRKSEIRVWLAIFNCEFKGLAKIGYSRLQEITQLSRKSVGQAVKSLVNKGLLRVVVRGRFKPSPTTGSLGQPSVYKIFPRQIDAPASQISKQARPIVPAVD